MSAPSGTGLLDPYWSSSIAPTWEDGLAIGDGRTGALLHGGPGEHRIVLAHERVVLPADPPRHAPRLAADLPELRRLIAEGDAQAAADLAVRRAADEGYPGLQWTDPLVPVAAVVLPGTVDEVVDLRRVVDPETGLVEVRWRTPVGTHRIRAFVSRATGALVVATEGLPGAPRLEPPENAVVTTAGVRGGNASRTSFARPAATEGEVLELAFHAEWPIRCTGARTTLVASRGVDGRGLLLAAVDPLIGDPPAGRRLDASTDFETALADHRRAVAAESAPIVLDLAGRRDDADVESLLRSDAPDRRRRLLELQHRAAQATIRASTGELPPTLQGVWSGTFDPAWSSDYTMNGNVQNGALAALSGEGRPDLLRTWSAMLEGFADDLRDNAERLFGAAGFLLPSRCSPTHARTTHFDETYAHEFWTAGAPWAAAMFFDDVWHTADFDHLAEHVYPFGREVERFFDSFLVDDGATLVFSPSYSPENTSPTFASQACRNATMDRAALWRLTTDLRRAAALLGVDEDLDARRADRLRRLPPYRIAPDGTLAEWLDEGVVERLGHRTVSQLLGLFHEPEPELVEDPRLGEAIRALVAAKLRWRASAPGREEMPYGLVQLGLAAAAVGDGEAAHECVDRISRRYFLPSLMTTHELGAIFNVDASGGFPAVIHAMLAGSSIGTVRLLPALPAAWPEGRVEGLRLRGGIGLDRLAWTPDEALAEVTALPGSTRLRGGSGLQVVPPPGWACSSEAVELPDGQRMLLRFRPERG